MSAATVSAPRPANAPAWATVMRRVTNYMVNDFAGGPRAWKFAWVINFQKAGTLPFLAVLIAWYHNTSTAAWIYLAMHGSYGLVWIIKDLAFPDPAWQQPHHDRRRHQRLPERPGLVLGVRLAADLGHFSAGPTRCRTTPGSACASVCASSGASS